MQPYPPNSMVLKSIRDIEKQHVRYPQRVDLQEISQMFTKYTYFQPHHHYSQQRSKHMRTQVNEYAKESLFNRYIELGVANTRDPKDENKTFRLNHRSRSLNIKNINPDMARGKMLFVNNSIKFRHLQQKFPKSNLQNIKVNTTFFLKEEKTIASNDKQSLQKQTSIEKSTKQLPAIKPVASDKSVKKMPILGGKSSLAERMKLFRTTKYLNKHISLQIADRRMNLGPWATEPQQNFQFM